MPKGLFIVFEGIEGAGKTTQMEKCASWLRGLGKEVVTTREPGGTSLGIVVRQLLLQKSSERISEMAELLLYAADRAQHVSTIIRPELALGRVVLCDRYTASTIAYQGYGRGLSLETINKLNAIATGGLKPDLTIWLDVDVEVGLARKQGEKLDRIEQEEIDFHRRVQQGYRELAENDLTTMRLDGFFSQETVHGMVQNIKALF